MEQLIITAAIELGYKDSLFNCTKSHRIYAPKVLVGWFIGFIAQTKQSLNNLRYILLLNHWSERTLMVGTGALNGEGGRWMVKVVKHSFHTKGR